MSFLESVKSSVLGHPAVFSLYNWLIGARRGTDIFIRDYVRARTGQRVLDVGCGNGRLAPYFGAMAYTGIDDSTAYIDDARTRYPHAHFLCADICTHPYEAGSAELAVILGVLHHLDDAQCRALMKGLASALKPAGELVIAEPVFTKDQNPVARLIIRNDRGRHVRTEEGYRALLDVDFLVTEHVVRHDLLHIPFTHLLMRLSPKA